MGTQQQPVIDQTMLNQQQQQPQQQQSQQQSQQPHPSQQQQHHHQQNQQHHQQQSQVPTHVAPQYTPHPEHYTYNIQYAPPNAYAPHTYPYQPYPAYSMAAYQPVNANSVSQPQSSVPQTRASAPIQMSQPIYNSRPPHNQNLPNTSFSTRVKKPAILKDPITKSVVPLPDQSSTATSASTATATDSTNSTPSTKSTSSSSKAPISSSSSSTPGDTPQELLKKIADVTTADNSESVHDSSTTTVESSDLSTAGANNSSVKPRKIFPAAESPKSGNKVTVAAAASPLSSSNELVEQQQQRGRASVKSASNDKEPNVPVEQVTKGSTNKVDRINATTPTPDASKTTATSANKEATIVSDDSVVSKSPTPTKSSTSSSSYKSATTASSLTGGQPANNIIINNNNSTTTNIKTTKSADESGDTTTTITSKDTEGDGTEDQDENSTASSSASDPFAQLEYAPGQFHPILNKDGKRVYSIPFLYEVGTKLCNISFKTQESSQDEAMRIDPFAPSYNRSNNANIRPGDMGHRSGGGSSGLNYNSRNQAGQENAKPRKIIPATPISQEVELKQASNPWRPSKVVVEEDDLESLKKKFRSILNKLTPDNFQSLANSVTELKIDTEEKLGDVIDIVFAKALAEPGYCVLYGEMCSHLKKITAGQANFGNTLLKRCQAQFQADTYSGLNLKEREDKIEAESDPDVKKQLCDELYEEKYRCRMRGLGLIKFIGELYKIEMLNDVIMMDCVVRLLQDTSEESIECLCDLLATIGEKLDKGQKKPNSADGGKQHHNNQQQQSNQQKQAARQNQQKASNSKSFADAVISPAAPTQAAANSQQVQKPMNTLDQVFEELHKIKKNNKELTLRIKFKLLDTCELREKHNWRSKQTKDNNPKKLEEIREAHEKEIEQERRQQQQVLGPRRGGGPGQQGDNRRQLGHSGGSSNQLSSLDHHHNQQHHNNGPNHRGGAMHTSASSHSLRDNSMMKDMRSSNSNSALAAESFQKTKDSIKNLTFLQQRTTSESLRPSHTPLLRFQTGSSNNSGNSNNK